MKLTEELQDYDQCLRQLFLMQPNYELLTYLLPSCSISYHKNFCFEKIVNTGLSASDDGV